jgi:hypothetical protein
VKDLLSEKQFVVNSNGNKVGVLLDIKTYKKIEKLFEDFILGEKMLKAKKSKTHSLKTAARKLKYELQS